MMKREGSLSTKSSGISPSSFAIAHLVNFTFEIVPFGSEIMLVAIVYVWALLQDSV